MHSGGMFRKSLWTLGVVFATTSFAARADEPVSVSKLNRALGRIVKEVLETHQASPNPLFKAIEFRIDEKATVLDDDDRFATKVRLKAVASRSRWSPKVETSLGADLGFTADRLKKEATLELAADLETDTLGLVRFAGGELVTDACRRQPQPTSFDVEYCNAVKKLAAAKNIDEVILVVAGLGESAVKEAAARLAKAEADLAAAPPAQQPNLEKRVAAAKEDLAMAKTVAAELKRGQAAGSANGTLRVSFRSYDAAPYGELRDVEVYLDKNRFDAKLKFTMKDIRDIDSYFKMKPTVVDALKKLEAGSAEEMEDAKRFLEIYLNIAGSLIEGK